MPFPTLFDQKLAFSCCYLWLYVISLFILAVEVTNIFVLTILIAGPISTYCIIINYAIPQPSELSVNEILGKELTGEIISGNLDLILSNEPSDEFVMKIIAHRFAGIEAPENSLEALELCYKNGATAVEFDLILTSDLIPIVFHDWSLERVTSLIGNVKEKTWDELKCLDISIKHPFHKKFEGTHIPLFDDVVRKCVEYDLRMFIDIKEDRQEVVNVILSTYEKYPKLYKRAIVSSFNGIVLYNIRRSNPQIITSMAWRPLFISHRKFALEESERIPYSTFLPTYYFSRVLDVISTWFFYHLARELIGLSAVCIHKDVITPETVLYWKKRNVRVFAWTINNNLEKLHFSRNLGIGYFTDSMLCQ